MDNGVMNKVKDIKVKDLITLLIYRNNVRDEVTYTMVTSRGLEENGTELRIFEPNSTSFRNLKVSQIEYIEFVRPQ